MFPVAIFIIAQMKSTNMSFTGRVDHIANDPHREWFKALKGNYEQRGTSSS